MDLSLCIVMKRNDSVAPLFKYIWDIVVIKQP